MLAIGGPSGYSSSTALALRDTTSKALMKTKKDDRSNAPSAQPNKFRGKKKVKAPKVRLPNVSLIHACRMNSLSLSLTNNSLALHTSSTGGSANGRSTK